MKVDRLILGSFETNSYIVRAGEAQRDCLIVDTGLESGALTEFLAGHELNPAAVVFTHGHADHVCGVVALRKNYSDIKVFIHKLDAGMLTGAESNLSELAGMELRTGPADCLLEEGDIVEQAGIRLDVLHTPGHTRGGISLYSREEGVVFVGDALFAGSVGRTDFPGASTTQLIMSIRDKLLTLPGETVVYPGHGPVTTIAREKQYNPFLQ
jgi:glyoxylase-like metal-dependent hydrolase (beta-lactamase superfamily II)